MPLNPNHVPTPVCMCCVMSGCNRLVPVRSSLVQVRTELFRGLKDGRRVMDLMLKVMAKSMCGAGGEGREGVGLMRRARARGIEHVLLIICNTAIGLTSGEVTGVKLDSL